MDFFQGISSRQSQVPYLNAAEQDRKREIVRVLAGTEGNAPACCRGNSVEQVRKVEVHFKVVSGTLVV